MAGVRTSKRKGGKGGKAVKRLTHKAAGYYSRQAVRTIANRKRRREKHLRRHPNDDQTKKLLD